MNAEEDLADALDRIARFGEAFTAASDRLPTPKRHSHAGEAMVATLAAYARRTLDGHCPATAPADLGKQGDV